MKSEYGTAKEIDTLGKALSCVIKQGIIDKLVLDLSTNDEGLEFLEKNPYDLLKVIDLEVVHRYKDGMYTWDMSLTSLGHTLKISKSIEIKWVFDSDFSDRSPFNTAVVDLFRYTALHMISAIVAVSKVKFEDVPLLLSIRSDVERDPLNATYLYTEELVDLRLKRGF